MKRDMELVRQILLALDENPVSTGQQGVDVAIDGRSKTEISYHIMLLDEAGLLKAMDASDSEGLDWMPLRVTWEGHEFLEHSRDESLWRKAVKVAREKAGGVALDVLMAVLATLAVNAATGKP